MRIRKTPAIVLLLLFAIEALDANRRRENIPNICDINERGSQVHCYCEFSKEVHEADKAECWVFNGRVETTDPVWASFTSQPVIQHLAFKVRTDGVLDFVPKKVLRLLKKLKNYRMESSSIPRLDSYVFSNFTSVEEMTLMDNEIIYLSKHTFYNLPNLTTLVLDENQIKELVAETFYGLPSLQKLYLTNNNISTIQDGAFNQLVNLLDLELDKNIISDLRKGCFEGLANLQRLDLRRNKIVELKSFTFSELWNLHSLLLDYNDISVLAQRTFDGLSQLRKLSLSYNKLVMLTSGLFEGIRGLSALDMRHNKLRKFSLNNIAPIYDNLKYQNSVITLYGNNFSCDCHLVWMHKLRLETKSTRVRSSLENFACKLDNKLPLSSHTTFFETSMMDIDSQYDAEVKTRGKDYFDSSSKILNDDTEDSYTDESKVVKKDVEKIFLQIPIEMLPCPQDVKSVTDRTYTHPSQNEAKDYRNLISTSLSSTQTVKSIGLLITMFITIIILLISSIEFFIIVNNCNI